VIQGDRITGVIIQHIFILKQQKRLLPVKRGPTVKKIALWLFLGRGQNAEMAQWIKGSIF
jgi:hypothetical protein